EFLVNKVAPLFRYLLFQFAAGPADFGKFLLPFVGPRRIDNRPGAMTDLIAGNARIERTAPGAAQDINRLSWIRTAAESPQHLFGIADIHIIVHHNHVAAEVGAGAALARNQSSLPCMTWIALLD